LNHFPCYSLGSADKDPNQMMGAKHPFEILRFAQYDNGFSL